MLTERDTMRCESIFNDAHTHRYLWKRVWAKEKPFVAVIMLNPCISDNIVTDTTTGLVVNNVARLEEYGGVIILNLYSILTSKLNFRWNSDEELNDADNDTYIQRAANECTAVILAWGKAEASNQRVAAKVRQVLTLLKPHADKLFVISDGERTGLHPLTPSIRSNWQLQPFKFPESEPEEPVE